MRDRKPSTLTGWPGLGDLGHRLADGFMDHPVKLALNLCLEVGLDLVDIAELGEGPAGDGPRPRGRIPRPSKRFSRRETSLHEPMQF